MVREVEENTEGQEGSQKPSKGHFKKNVVNGSRTIGDVKKGKA